jgi:hypothetical protein
MVEPSIAFLFGDASALIPVCQASIEERARTATADFSGEIIEDVE